MLKLSPRMLDLFAPALGAAGGGAGGGSGSVIIPGFTTAAATNAPAAGAAIDPASTLWARFKVNVAGGFAAYAPIIKLRNGGADGAEVAALVFSINQLRWARYTGSGNYGYGGSFAAGNASESVNVDEQYFVRITTGDAAAPWVIDLDEAAASGVEDTAALGSFDYVEVCNPSSGAGATYSDVELWAGDIDRVKWAQDNDVTSTSAFNLKGNRFTPTVDRELTFIRQKHASATVASFRPIIARVTDDLNCTILEILHHGAAQSVGSADMTEFLAAPLTLEAGQTYYVGWYRPDGVAFSTRYDNSANADTDLGTAQAQPNNKTAGFEVGQNLGNGVSYNGAYYQILEHIGGLA